MNGWQVALRDKARVVSIGWTELRGVQQPMAFDSRNRLVSAGETNYRYDAENQRIGVNQTRYVVNSQPALSQVLVKEENGVKTFYVYGLGLLGDEKEGEYRSYHFDYRGSTVALTDRTGKVVERFQYGPYGELLKGEASITPFLFNGKYGVMSDDNGLYYMRARFYSPEIKRFVNMDVLLGSVGEGQTLNRYAFVTGQPISYVDPFGLDGEDADSWLNTAIDITITVLDAFDTASDIATVVACATGVATMAGIAIHAGKKAALRNIKKELLEIAQTEVKRLLAEGRRTPTALSVVRDKKTGRTFIDVSGKPRPQNIPSELRKRMPEESLEKWPVNNCAEFKACNQALTARPEAQMEDFDIVTINIRDGTPKKRCQNCQITTDGAKVFTDD